MNPAIPLLGLYASLLFSSILFLASAATFGTLNVMQWDTKTASASIMIVIITTASGLLFYALHTWPDRFSFLRPTDLCVDEDQKKSFFDIFMTHYGHVASIATFCAAIVYTAKSILPSVGIVPISFLMSLGVISVFTLYSVVFTRTTISATRQSMGFSLLIILMFCLDAVFMQIAIEGAASLFNASNSICTKS